MASHQLYRIADTGRAYGCSWKASLAEDRQIPNNSHCGISGGTMLLVNCIHVVRYEHNQQPIRLLVLKRMVACRGHLLLNTVCCY